MVRETGEMTLKVFSSLPIIELTEHQARKPENAGKRVNSKDAESGKDARPGDQNGLFWFKGE